ncbi:MAG: hypothetical protein IJW22_06810, partial [Clostridia bacterium]|nr:hypothetical protein [Clostridia bacterium]
AGWGYSAIVKSARGVRVLAPDINESKAVFHVSGDHIRFGLLALKNVGRNFLEAVIAERERFGPYRSFDDFLERLSSTDLNKRQVESLIKAGAFDNLGIYRSQLMAVYESMIDRQQSKNRSSLTGQLDMFSLPGADRPEITYPDLPEYGLRELLMQEKEASGMYFSGHLLDGFSNALAAPDICETRSLFETDVNGEYMRADRERVVVAGIVTAVTTKTTRKDERMAFFTLEDRWGEVECLVFPKVYEKISYLLRTDAVLRVEGTLSIREEENPKILVSVLSELPDNHTQKAPITAVPTHAGQAPSPKTVPKPTVTPEKAKILYLRVPSMSDPRWRRARNILEIFEGSLPVSVYDASKSSYEKQQIGFDCTAYTLRELAEILGDDNVVLK